MYTNLKFEDTNLLHIVINFKRFGKKSMTTGVAFNCQFFYYYKAFIKSPKSITTQLVSCRDTEMIVSIVLDMTVFMFAKL